MPLLSRSQRNQVYEAVQKADLEPGDFAPWSTKRSPGGDADKIVHLPTVAFCEVAYYQTEYFLSFWPAVDERRVRTAHSWESSVVQRTGGRGDGSDRRGPLQREASGSAHGRDSASGRGVAGAKTRPWGSAGYYLSSGDHELSPSCHRKRGPQLGQIHRTLSLGGTPLLTDSVSIVRWHLSQGRLSERSGRYRAICSESFSHG